MKQIPSLLLLIFMSIFAISCDSEEDPVFCRLQVNVTTISDFTPKGNVYIYKLGEWEDFEDTIIGIDADVKEYGRYSPSLVLLNEQADTVQRLRPVSKSGRNTDGQLDAYSEEAETRRLSGLPYSTDGGEFAFVDFFNDDLFISDAEWEHGLLYGVLVVPSVSDFQPCCILVRLNRRSVLSIDYNEKRSGGYSVRCDISPDTDTNRIVGFDIIKGEFEGI